MKVKLLFTEKNTKRSLFFIWVLSVCISIPFLFMAEYTKNPDQCQLNMSYAHLIYVLSLNFVFIFVPTIVLGFLYVYIIVKLKNHYKQFVLSEENYANSGFRVNTNRNYSTAYKSARHSSTSSQERASQATRQPIDNSKAEKYTVINYEVKPAKKLCIFCNSSTKKLEKHRKIVFKRYESQSSYHEAEKRESNKIVEDSNRLSPVRREKSLKKESSINRKSTLASPTKAYNEKLKFTIVNSMVTLAFFCCLLPAKIFLFWSYILHYFFPVPMHDDTVVRDDDLYTINLISYCTSLIYFFHCISNPIIYNISSAKFRSAFFGLGKLKPVRI